ncbi:AAA family ATPase [Thermosulfurimonas dismutans]|uniref:Prophage Lp2 protein 4 n=1 Tax=Thermosulfurimonas dismutans TaxID=999894 RepID=A0A179D3I2_9BACT|nr:AAA family ATPase [Thermosulfurimonas dismutans]OAQ20032.1 Prophage Lp2 protein 4 [Thermosulfurimonas dismutans]
MRIKRVKIHHFRNLKNIEFEVGKKITVIAGRNGTGKSALLGLIGHIFDFKGTQRTLLGRRFATEFSEIFRFSLKHEKNSKYDYEVIFDDNTVRKAYFRGYNETEKRFRIHVGKKAAGEGKINLPVIYLGLERLFPIAREKDKDINLKPLKIENSDKEWYEHYYNLIFASEELINIEDFKTQHKRFYSPSHKTHDAFSNSAGEDNLGQILTAILSFKKLKDRLKDKYKGGILLIDEVDATLFPGAQRKLLEVFLKFSKEFKIQIIFTTHSTDILTMLEDKMFSNSSDISFLFLEKRGEKVIPYQNLNKLKQIISALRYEICPTHENPKINLYTEDEEARIFLRNIIDPKLRKRVKISNLNLGAENYLNLLKHKAPTFPYSIIVLDGDKKKSRYKNVVYLPGEKRPENVIYDFLKSLSPEDKFWGTIGQYTKEIFLANKPNTDNREKMKKWFSEQKKYWGKGCAKVFKRWKEENKQLVDDFNKSLENAIIYVESKVKYN